MNQAVIDQAGTIFLKDLNTAPNRIRITTFSDGNFYFEVVGSARGYFDYSAVVKANTWTHVAMVFNGNLTGNIRLVVYVNGQPIVLNYTAVIPAITADLTSLDASIGTVDPAWDFDGKLHDMRLYNIPLTNDEILKLYHAPVQRIALHVLKNRHRRFKTSRAFRIAGTK